MESKQLQFDVLLGGREELPSQVPIMKFVAARAQEIAALTEAIEDPQRTGLVFQRLPKLMQRRAMSHNAKRMPRRLREIHLKQLERSGFPPKSKRPSRKYRRRPQNLLLEYNRRQKKFVWLETHIWHAKRFHMIEKWGYKLANFPNDKSFRACYRAGANHCLLQDISYYCCIELTGPTEMLLDGLKPLTNVDCGLTFAAKAFLSGNREGKVMIFHKGTYPYGAIGSVNFIWKNEGKEMNGKETVELSKKRILWIWCHPSIYSHICDEIISAFSLSQIKDISREADKQVSEVLPQDGSGEPVRKHARFGKQEKDIEKIKLATRNTFESVPEYCNRTGEVSMLLLKDTLNRLRLTGPLSQAILMDALSVSNVSCKDTPERKMDVNVMSTGHETQMEIDLTENGQDECGMEISTDTPGAIPQNVQWWKRFYTSECNLDAWKVQKTMWSSLKQTISPAQFPPHQILALTIIDPRYQLPLKRKKVVPDLQDFSGQEDTGFLAHCPALISHSPIWNGNIRKEVTNSKLSNSKLAELRSRNLVPGYVEEEFLNMEGITITSSSSPQVDTSRVPVLLIQRPGSQDPFHKRLGFNSGWDVVLPGGWAMPLWLALIFRGARVGGLRESESLAFEAGLGPWTDHFAPDTASGQVEASSWKQELMDRYFRLPPNKRQNYIKLGVGSPFSCCWNVLVKDWSSEDLGDSEATFYVLRDKHKLALLRTATESCRSVKNLSKMKYRNCPQYGSSKISTDLTRAYQGVDRKCLVPVMIVVNRKGSPSNSSMICFPLLEDLEKLQHDQNFQGPIEEVHSDKNQEIRKELQSKHRKLLRHLRRQRVREKRKLEESSDSENNKTGSVKPSPLVIKKAVPPTKYLVDAHAVKMKSLWLPEVVSIKESCSRAVFGFVCKGDFSFTEACGVGLGYVVLEGLLQLLSTRNKQPLVLIRCPSSLQYRFAELYVC